MFLSKSIFILSFIAFVHAYVIPVEFRRTTVIQNLNQHTSQRHRRSSVTVPSSSIPVTTSSAPPAASTNTSNLSNETPKYVIAHHIVGNTFPYTLQDWLDDVILAHTAGIDGFALNVGKDDFEPARVADAYAAALQEGSNFKMFLSLDMSSMPCASPSDAQNLRNLVNTYISHPNQLQYDSRAFISTFSGETCTFGQDNVQDGWKSQFVGHPDLQGKIFFVPSFFVDPAKFSDFTDIMDGDFNWNSGWPIQVTTSFVDSLLTSILPNTNEATLTGLISSATSGVGSSVTALSSLQTSLDKFVGSTESDTEHLNGLASISNTASSSTNGTSRRIYMGAVSPWFFTHYSPQTFNKNFIYLADEHLYSKRWESVVASRSQFDIMQILTWNDYGESHYIGPIKGSQPNSQAWVDGMNHTGWLEMTEYYATAFKTGAYPPIEKDKIFMWSRPHPSQAQAPDPVGQPANFELSQDTVWAVVMTTAASTVTLSTSSTSSRMFEVPAGLSKLSIPITAGDTMKGTLSRNGQTILELNPQDFTFQGSPQTYNFNAFVASAISL